MKRPSTEWREQIAPDEASRFAGYAAQLKDIQTAKSSQYGTGRALHRKQLLASEAEFEVLGQLPQHACHGIFKTPGIHQALVRLSNGSLNIQSDKMPDIRGFAIKVLGINGPSALGTTTSAQDFLLINREVFGLKNSAEFMQLVLASAKGGVGLLFEFIKSYGLWGGISRLKSIIKNMQTPFTGFATERFYSSAPIACGPYAVRVRLLPASNQPSADAANDWGQDMKRRLAREMLCYDFQLQFFVSDSITPIEDGTVNWQEADAPYVTVAKLRLPKQEFTGDKERILAAKIDAEAFDPWCALAEHRPLGDVMRARKDAYFVSQKNRR